MSCEAVSVKRLKEIAGHEKFCLYCALSIGFLLLILQACFSVDLYKDSAAVYSPMARALSEGNWQEAFHPAIPNLNVILSAPLMMLGFPPEKALAVVSSLFYVATIPFVYLLLAVFLPRNYASFGSLCFACAPKVIRFSCSAIIDSGKLFFITAALFFLMKFIRSKYRSWKTALLFFLMLGGMSLARSEGFGNAVVLAGCLCLYWFIESVRERKLQAVLPSAVSVFLWGACILIRVLINGLVFGKFVFDERIANGFARLFHSAPAASAAASGTQVGLRVSWLHLFNQYIRGCYELYLVFSVIGLILILLNMRGLYRWLWPDAKVPDFVKWNHLYWIFFLVSLSNAVIFKASDIASYRYFLLNIPCMMVFTVISVCWVWKWCIRFLPPFIPAAAAAVIFMFQVQNGFDNVFAEEGRRQYETGREVGKLLGSEKETAKVWFGGTSIEWYYSGLKRAVPIETSHPDPASFKDFDYVLWHEEEKGFKALKNRKDLREIPLAGAEKIHLYKRLD